MPSSKRPYLRTKCLIQKLVGTFKVWHAFHESNLCLRNVLLSTISVCVCVQMASNDPDLPDPYADPQPGDLIEIFRPAYQHWALYLGDGYIINLTPVGQ